MNRSKLKTYAPQARRDFIKAVTHRAAFYGLMKDKVEPVVEQGDVAIIAGKPFPRAVAAKRKRLEERIRRQGFEQVMEAMAYTWFNRFAAIRFMELHGYLDHGYRVLSHPEGSATPEIVEHAEHIDLPGLDREKVIELKLEGTKEAELYRMLLVAQCNALHNAMPFLFEHLDDETELLLPENLLHSDSVIRKLVNEIPQEEWQEVEIIGWLYQFYISEKKDEVIGKVVKSEDIPAATQLFTPNWIVKYMVQNTLGRQWMATYPHSSLKEKMEFYIETSEQTPEVQEQLKAITPESLNPEELTLLDPACGSGHILVEAYDLLKAIYQERGYRTKDIPRLILQKNLYGLEIDDRAAQLAAFALMMKARADDRRIFSNGVRPHVLAIQESKGLKANEITEALNAPILKAKLPPREMLFEKMEEERTPLFSRKNLSIKGSISQADVAQIIDLFDDGKVFGSLIRVSDNLKGKLIEISERIRDVSEYGEMFGKVAAGLLRPLVEQGMVLAEKYWAVVTNPPYMGSRGMNRFLKGFSKRNYPDTKSDLFAMFVERTKEYAVFGGFIGLVTPYVWMFLQSYQKLREKLLATATLTTLVQLEYNAFEPACIPVCTFVFTNHRILQYEASYVKLSDFRGHQNQAPRTLQAIQNHNCGWFYTAKPDEFRNIPGSPFAYWASSTVRKLFRNRESVGKFCYVKKGLSTGDDASFVRLWFEVSIANTVLMSHESQTFVKWYPLNKGGAYRRWYGNRLHIIDWMDDGKRLRKFGASVVRNPNYYFMEMISWSMISSTFLGVRYYGKGFVFEGAGPSLFPQKDQWYVLALLESVVASNLIRFMNPTMNINIADICNIPVVKGVNKEPFDTICKEGIHISKMDWDSFETSWDFEQCSLLKEAVPRETVQELVENWIAHCEKQTAKMKRLEEANNRFFIRAYGLQNEMKSEISDEEITLFANPKHRYGVGKEKHEYKRLVREDITKELISYAVGCMMGRYSLDKPRLIYAHSGNQGFDSNQYKTFPADEDGIIPITDIDWFHDDAANRVVEFISVAWPKEHLEENLRFVAESLGPKRGESARETIRRYLSTGFYKHHLSMYKKRPIYWLFSSGKQRPFQCLVYLHRYNEGTLSRMRTEYVIPLQGKIDARIEQLKDDIRAATSTSHGKRLQREQDKLVKQKAELHAFDEKLRHYADKRISLDLDDGVKVNYGKFGDLLAEVKAITGKKGK